MSRQTPDTSSPSDDDSQNVGERQNISHATPDLARMAEMVACGDLPIPLDWSPDRLRKLLADVHVLRRRRLVQLIARAIASELCREERQEED